MLPSRFPPVSPEFPSSFPPISLPFPSLYPPVSYCFSPVLLPFPSHFPTVFLPVSLSFPSRFLVLSLSFPIVSFTFPSFPRISFPFHSRFPPVSPWFPSSVGFVAESVPTLLFVITGETIQSNLNKFLASLYQTLYFQHT